MNKKKENHIKKNISRRDFVIATAVTGISLTVFGCKKSETPKPGNTTPPIGGSNTLKITNAVIPSRMSFIVGSDFSFQGEGFAMGDKLVFVSVTDATKNFTVDLKSVTTNSCTFTVPAGFTPNIYRITVVRGNQSLLLGSSTIEVPFQNIPDLAGKTVKGTVYAAGVGIANVIVSDGIEVTKTDQNGIYYLSSKKEKQFVFVSIPGGYEVTTNNSILPTFYKGFSANATTVEVIDFELNAVNNDKHVMLALGDMHLANRNNDVSQFQNGFLTDVAKTITKYKNEGYKVYGLTLGDMTWDAYWYANNYSFSQYLNLMKTINIPVFHTMGNHDNDPYINADWLAETGFRASLGPTYYSFNVGKVHYIVLDNIQYINDNGAQGIIGDRNYNGVIVADQIAWLKKDLATITDKSTPIVVSMHIQLNNNPTLSGQNETATLRLNNSTEFINALAEFTDVNVITGHTHICYSFQNNAKLMEHNSGAICATWWWTGANGYAGNHICKDGAPGGYAVWKFNDRSYQWLYKSIGFEENYQFRAYDLNKVLITAAKYAPKSTDDKLAPYVGSYGTANSNNEILLNVWGYDKEWKVEMLENGTTSLAITRVRTLDPLHIISYEALRLNVGQTPTEDFVTTNSAHFFKAKANSATSSIVIKVTDRFGNVYTETMTRPKDLTVASK